MASPLKLSAVVTLDTSQVGSGVQTTKQAFSSIGTAAVSSAAQVQKLVDAQLRIAQPAANMNSRAADIAAYGQELDRLTAKFDPLFAAYRKLQSAIAEINQAQSVGAITASQAIDLRIRETNAYNALATSITRAAAATKAFAQAAVDRVTITPDRGADIAAYAAQLDALQAKFDPLFAAQQKYQATLEAIDQAQRVGAISGSQAVDLRIREKNAYDALTSSINNAAAARKAFAQAAVDRVTITPDREADIAAYGQELNRQRAMYNPRYAVISDYQSNVADIRKAQERGAITEKESADEIQRRRRIALGALGAIKGSTSDSSPASQFRRTNLTYQLFDIGQGAVSGQPLGMIAAQQLPQIAQMYAGQGGVNTALKDFNSLASGAAKFITPVTATVGALTAALAIGAKAWNDYLASEKEVETAAAGLGRAVAGTQASMDAAARAGASAAGISVSSARSMEAAFLRTGKIGSENYEKLISISKDFGATIGVDSDAAGQALAQMFSDPEKAAQALYQQYGLIDAATARQATNLARSNRQSEAQAVLLDALPGKLAKATESTTAFGRAWDQTATWVGNAWDALGRFTNNVASGPSLENQRAMADVRLQNAQGSLLPDFLSGRSAAQKQVDDLDAQIKKRDEDNAKRQAEAQRIQLSIPAVNAANASPANADAQKIQSLRNSIAAMTAGKDATDDLTIRQQITTAIDAQTRVLDALVNKQARAIELDRLDVQIQNERNPLVRADLEARRTRIQLSDQEIATSDLENQAANARNRIILETISTAKTQTNDMQTEIGIRSKLTAQVAASTMTADQANSQLQTELALRPLILAAATAEVGQRQVLLDIVTKLRAAYDGMAQAQRDASGASYLSDQQRNLDRLRFQTSIAGRGANDQAMALAQYDAEVKIREIGASTDQAAKIRANAVATEQWNQQLARTTDAWNTIKRAEEDAIDSAVDKLSSGDFKGALDAIADDAKKTLLQLGVTNPLKNALTGSNYGTFGDVGGMSGVFKQMFGGDKSVASMAVTAGTVMINGGVTAGAGSLIPQAANNNALGLVASNALTAGGDMGKYAAAIRSIESAGSGGYSALGALTKSGDRAYGAYQVMGANIPSWTKEALGQSLTPSQFLADPKAQDTVFERFFGKSLAKYGNANDAASVWLTGRPLSQGAGAADALGTTGASYVAKFNTALGKLGDTTAATTQNLGVFGSGLGQFGQSLGSAFNGAGAGAGGGGIFGSLIGGTSNFFTSLFGGNVSDPSSIFWKPNTTYSSFLRGFDVGGFTGPGARLQPAGVVHKGEVVWSQDDVRRAGGVATVEAMRLGYRGYDRGSVVGGGQTIVNTTASPAPVINVHNYNGSNVTATETTDSRGERQTDLVIADTVGNGMKKKGGGGAKALRQVYGVKPKGIAR